MDWDKMPKTALIVDDETHVRLLLKLVLKSLRFESIAEVDNGEKAIHAYSKEPTDIVLMDINMPQMTGIEALQGIQRMDPDSTVVMLTSMSSRKMIEDCAASGASYYIRKDTPVDEIRIQLEKVFSEIFV